MLIGKQTPQSYEMHEIVLNMFASINQRATMKMDMTTCDRMSASSLFIRAAIEATASEHSS